VNGPVVAQQFATPGLPYARGILNILSPELWQAFQNSAQAWQGKKSPDTSPSHTQPPEDEPAEDNTPANESKSSPEPSANKPSQ
jgi:hypothetical protein